MKLWFRIATGFVCAAALCVAQGNTPAPPSAASPSAVPDSGAPAAGTLPETKPAPNPTVEPPPTRKTPAAAAPQKSPAPAGSDGKPYVIGALDVLYIRVWNNPQLTGMVNVQPDGMFSLALIGEVRADGLTVPQLIDVLKTKLGEFLNSPEVDVSVTKINSKKYFMFGEIGRPGEYPLIGKTTILDALSNSGGFRETANQKKIYLLRGSTKYFFNYKDVIQGKSLKQDIPIESGDKIVVPQ
jgi:polysaccharide export outer membrane protein